PPTRRPPALGAPPHPAARRANRAPAAPPAPTPGHGPRVRRTVTAPGERAGTRSPRRGTVGDDAPRPKPLRHRTGRTAGRGPAVGPVAGEPPDPHAGRRPRDPPPHQPPPAPHHTRPKATNRTPAPPPAPTPGHGPRVRPTVTAPGGRAGGRRRRRPRPPEPAPPPRTGPSDPG